MRRLTNKVYITLLLLLPIQWLMAAPLELRVEGLMSNMVILNINGQQRFLKVGKTSPEGVKLLAANSRFAEVEVNGERQQLSLSSKISGSYQPPTKASVSIQKKYGQYLTTGSINGRPVSFLVDTGATSISMSMSDAQKLGITINPANLIQVGTAGGVVRGYHTMLEQVKVGQLKASYVRAVILESGFDGEILLGMSFLQHVKMREDSGVLILEQHL